MVGLFSENIVAAGMHSGPTSAERTAPLNATSLESINKAKRWGEGGGGGGGGGGSSKLNLHIDLPTYCTTIETGLEII